MRNSYSETATWATYLGFSALQQEAPSCTGKGREQFLEILEKTVPGPHRSH